MTTFSWPLIGSLGCILLGFTGVCWVAHIRRKNLEFARRAIVFPGIVVELASGMEGEVAPRYSFTPEDGKPRTVLSPASYSPARHIVGQKVDVLFDPATEESRLKGWFENRGAEVILAILSLAVLAVGICGTSLLLT